MIRGKSDITSLSQLKHLVTLNLGKNKITSDSFLSCHAPVNLNDLNLSFNHLIAIDFTSYRYLKFLNLESNGLFEFSHPKTMPLKQLVAWKNVIT